MLANKDKGSPEDKMRAFILFYLAVKDISKADTKDFEKALEEAGCDKDSLNYIKQ